MTQSRTVDASYRITLEELLTSHEMAMKVLNSRRPWLLRQKRGDKVVVGLMVVMMLLCLGISAILGIDSSGLYAVVVIFLIMSGVVICLPWIVKGVLRRQFKKAPALGKMVHFTVDATGVLLRTEGLSESSIKWPGYLRVARTVKGFLFFQNEQVYNWLPHHALASDRDEDEVASLASQHAAEYLDWV
jgi:hypothetical protein